MPPQAPQRLVRAPAQLAELDDAVGPQADRQERDPEVGVDRAQAVELGQGASHPEGLPDRGESEPDRPEFSVGRRLGRLGSQRRLPAQLDLAAEAGGQHLVGQRPLLGLQGGADPLGRQTLDGQVGGREPDVGLQRAAGRQAERDAAVGLAGQLEAPARNGRRQLGGVDAGQVRRAFDRALPTDRDAGLGRQFTAEGAGLDHRHDDRVALARPSEGDVAHRDGAGP
jgi:hypothetical protein